MNRGKKYSVVTRHTGRSRSDSDGFEDLEGPSLWGAPRGKGVRRTPYERLGGFGGVPRSWPFLFSLFSGVAGYAGGARDAAPAGYLVAEGPVGPHIYF